MSNGEVRAGRRRGSAGAVALNDVRSGCPVFLLPALHPTPWIFQQLMEAADLRQPVYGLRCPDLEWRHDVMSLRELTSHYLTTIRTVHPDGPYILVGYSFGGVVAFDLAKRLVADGMPVRRLVMLDTGGPPTRPSRAPLRGRMFSEWTISTLIGLGLIGLRTLDRLRIFGIDDRRAALAMGTGPLTTRELRHALATVANPGPAAERMDFDQLSERLVALLEAKMPPAAWNRLATQASSPDPRAVVKAIKIVRKNHLLALDHRPTGRFDGPITIYARNGNRRVLGWERFSTQPLDVRWVGSPEACMTHDGFLDTAIANLYAADFRQLVAN
jgi:pimeloyl-ACP methyl ester carboxylesterase